MKRKVEDSLRPLDSSDAKRQQTLPFSSDVRESFRPQLFDVTTRASFKNAYESSAPYPHAVVPSLIEPNLLKSVRSEITTHISFTLKETDIYRIHQSGDLANLSKLDSESLSYLPSLVRLRDALYSPDFRDWVSEITGAGKVSGIKTDMAVNVYTPGSYLLCHDDVIGSRRVSYILYLTNPDDPWKPEWGGGLRLYPTELRKNNKGEKVKVPLPEHTLNIPPSFGQLSFFTVRPGESYHDVEEVYHGEDAKQDGQRIRMAISGWYHIPQEGEDGFEKGAEEAQAQKSSLAQLEGAADEFDEPQIELRHFDESRVVFTHDAKSREIDPSEGSDTDEDTLSEQDLTFLLEYISPSFLTPEMTEKLASSFEENSFLQLNHFLREKFAKELKKYIQKADSSTISGQGSIPDWKMARPPHKQRFLYLQSQSGGGEAPSANPITLLLADLLQSHAFKKWLAVATGFNPLTLVRQSAIARRFRRGGDYALASGYPSETPRIEFTMSLTPSSGWEEGEQHNDSHRSRTKKSQKSNGHHKHKEGNVKIEQTNRIEFGGEEVYMAGDDDSDSESIHSKSLPHVGRKSKSDPAVYKATHDDDDDGILFTDSPSWNQLSIVLRDKGTLRFVKYVSQAARGDRWDIKGEVELSPEAFDGEDDGDQEGGEGDDSDQEMEGEEGEEEEEEEEEENDDEDDKQ